MYQLTAGQRKGTKRKVKVKPVEWTWGRKEQDAFDKLKECLVNAPCLTYPDFTKPFLLRCDASRSGFGAVLTQVVEEGEDPRPVAFASRGLHGGEKNYSAYRLEFKALHWAITKKFKDHLLGREFEVHTDHNPLVYVLTSAKVDATTIRWLGELASYNFTITYKPGKENTDADVMSRIPDTKHISQAQFRSICDALLDSEATLAETMVVNTYPIHATFSGSEVDSPQSKVDWSTEQQKDPTLKYVFKYVRRGKPPNSREKLHESTSTLKVLRGFDKLVLMTDVLYRVTGDDDGERHQLLLPDSYKDFAWSHLHCDLGHPGRERSLSLLQERFYWPGMYEFVENKIKSCKRCVVAKSPHLPESAPLHPISTSQPMELICVDFLSVEPSGGCGNILVVTDHFSKYAQAYATRNQTARTTARVLYDNFIVHYGFPGKLHSDQGPNFESQVIKELCSLAGVKKFHTTPYHPMGNGITERYNRTLLNMLRSLSVDQKSKWKTFLPSLTHAYNCTRHSSTGYSPYYVMFGRTPRLPIDLVLHLPGPKVSKAYIKDLEGRIKYTYHSVQESIKRASAKQKVNYDRKVRGAVPCVGDHVLVKQVGLKGKHKLANKWEEEVYQIMCQPNPDIPVYEVRGLDNGKVKVLHRNMLLPLAIPLSDECGDVKPKAVPKPRTNSDKSVSEPSHKSDCGVELDNTDCDDSLIVNIVPEQSVVGNQISDDAASVHSNDNDIPQSSDNVD